MRHLLWKSFSWAKYTSLKQNYSIAKRGLSKSSNWLCNKAEDGHEGLQAKEGFDENESPLKMLDNSADFSGDDPQTVDDIWATPTYPKGTPNPRRDQARHNKVDQGTDPASMSIILFPGQGVQYVKMAKETLHYPNVKDMFDLASNILGYDLLQVCLTGPKSDLDRTEMCQPAVVVSSLAAVEMLRDENPNAIDSCAATAGFSVGEITALIFAGALSFEDGLKLVKVRAEAMQGCSEMVAGGMMTVFYGADSKLDFACHVAKKWCEKQGIMNADCRIANYLFPGCKVIAGNTEALDFIKQHADEFKLRRLKDLPVSGAFHTSLMIPAVEPMKEIMNAITIKDPIISVHSNVTGKPYQDKNHIVKQLPKQVYSPVKWEQTMHVLYERPQSVSFPKTYECGPGSSLSVILKKVNAKAAEKCSTFKI